MTDYATLLRDYVTLKCRSVGRIFLPESFFNTTRRQCQFPDFPDFQADLTASLLTR